MGAQRRERVGLAAIVLWLTAALPLAAQLPLPPVDELLPAPDWPESAVEVPLSLPPAEGFVDSPTPPVRSARDGGGMGSGGMGGGPLSRPGGGDSPFSAYAFFQPASDLPDQPGAFQVRGEGFTLGLPLSLGPNGVWIGSARVEQQSFETDASLPGSVQPFPGELWNINLSLLHIHPLANGWTAGAMVGVGSASDRPFASIREMNANLLAFLKIPTRESDAWNFSLFYSPLGQLAFPIPGLAYSWQPSERFQMDLGLPFSLAYRPTDTISFNLNYLPLTNASATVCWTPSELWTVYGGYQTQSQGYQLADRLDVEERLFHFDQRLQLGGRRTLAFGFSLDCSAAYLFDRSYFRSDSFFGEEAARLRIDPGAQLMLRLEWAR